MLEREVARGSQSYVPYVSVEPFWDSRYADVTRTRVIGGATLSLNQRFAYEVNLTYQHDKTYNFTGMNTAGCGPSIEFPINILSAI